jgi:hypothetical protein
MIDAWSPEPVLKAVRAEAAISCEAQRINVNDLDQVLDREGLTTRFPSTPIIIEGIPETWGPEKDLFTIENMVKNHGQEKVKLRTPTRWRLGGEGYDVNETLAHYVEHWMMGKNSPDSTHEAMYVFDRDGLWVHDFYCQRVSIKACFVLG